MTNISCTLVINHYRYKMTSDVQEELTKIDTERGGLHVFITLFWGERGD